MIEDVDPLDPIFEYYARLGRVRDFVKEHLHEEISLETAAAIATLEPKYFSAYFREKTGRCFTEWLTSVRVRRAMRLMTEKNITITRAALSVGYQNLRTFERAFDRCTGMTPSAYRWESRPDRARDRRRHR